jgi:DNA (cytosine-5)-methyltransferase 1
VNELALFAGAGGGILGGHLLGWRTVCAVEWEAYPASVLCARQNDKILPTFPIWDDVQTFDGKPWAGIVDVVSGGFPCQDISASGRGKGITGSRSSMWKHMARIIGEVQPQYCLVENSPMLTSRGLGVVLGDLSSLGFDAEWGVLSAADVGAKHLRERIWIVGKNTNSKCQRWNKGNDAQLETNQTKWSTSPISIESIFKGLRKENWQTEPSLGRVVNGFPAAVDRLKAIGNGQVPLCAATAWRLLKERLDGHEQRGMAQ